ncbi:NAD-binding protein [Ceratobasidium sp. AG-I]|nr:NAD-binding protein [Ceratobasidium sp. AG-I]
MGTVSSILEQTFPQAPRWSVEQIPDLNGQVMLVTGGNAGIGRETCKVLLNKGAKVYMASRCPKRASAAVAWLKETTYGKEPVYLQLDLADLQSVRTAAAEFLGKESELHCLFNNGGVFAPPFSHKTVEGYDLQFGANVLGHYLLTTLLLPTMIHTAKHSLCAGGIARVINISSIMHLFAPAGGINYASLVPHCKAADKIRATLGPERLYAQSKWANIAFSNELAKRYASEGIVSISLHPGNIRTGIQRHISLSGVMSALAEVLQWDCSYGALTQLYAATTPNAAGLNGKYLVPWARHDVPRHDTQDALACQMLWEWLEAQVA